MMKHWLLQFRYDNRCSDIGQIQRKQQNLDKTEILKSDVSIAKNYLTSKELEFLQDIVNMYLDIAESEFENLGLNKINSIFLILIKLLMGVKK